MNKPTEAQLKEFWEWCGFRLVPRFGGTDMTETLWKYPEGFHDSTLPQTDLNNLFKYAVPKLCVSMGKGIVGYWTVEVWLYPEVGVDYKGGLAEGYDLALALFWAIWRMVHSEKTPIFEIP